MPSDDLRFTGAICGFGTTSGTRVVVGCWTTSPFGAFADVMVEHRDGQRTLLAPNGAVAELVGSVYAFDEVRIVAVAVTVVGGVLAAVFGAVAGPLLLRLVFGDDVRLDARACAVVAAASLIAVANLVVAITAIAQDRSRVLVTVWAAAAVAAAAAVLWWPADSLYRVVWAFLVAELVAFVGLVVDDQRATSDIVGPSAA